MLANHQHCGSCPCADHQGGGGDLRVFELSDDLRSFQVVTYSPHRDDYLQGPEHEFELVLSERVVETRSYSH